LAGVLARFGVRSAGSSVTPADGMQPPLGVEETALPAAQATPASVPWDQAEADRLLYHLRTELDHMRRRMYGGRFPPVLANVVRIGVEVCEAYVANRDVEAARGWDPMELLRMAVPCVLSMARGEHYVGKPA
jgi:hypothetical protein